MASITTNERKTELRNAVRLARRSGFECGEAHSMRLIELIVRNGYKAVAAYEEFDNEPSLAGLREWCGLNGVEVLLPEMLSLSQLVWWVGDRSAELAEAQLVIMPALAAGRDGSRLGRGKGYYDRAVADLATPRVVVVHDSELFDSVPTNELDQRVSAVVTCSETLFVDGRLN